MWMCIISSSTGDLIRVPSNHYMFKCMQLFRINLNIWCDDDSSSSCTSSSSGGSCGSSSSNYN